MPLKLIEAEELEASARRVYDEFLQQRGTVPNLFKTIAQVPKLLESLYDHYAAVCFDGQLSARIKALVALRVALTNQCTY